MSERMKQDGRLLGVAPASLWQQIANRAPHPQWMAVCPGKGVSLPGKVTFSSETLLTVHITTRRVGTTCSMRGGYQHDSDRKTAGVKPV